MYQRGNLVNIIIVAPLALLILWSFSNNNDHVQFTSFLIPRTVLFSGGVDFGYGNTRTNFH
jgi:hypothetical protein